MSSDSLWFLGGVGSKIEYVLTWVSCSVVLVVTAIQLLNNEIDVKTHPVFNCSKLCPAKTAAKHSLRFGYGNDDGPHTWNQISRLCSGKRQSPIDLDTTVSVTKYHPYLYWWNYHRKPKNMVLLNDGHTAMLKGEWDDIPYFWPSTGNYSDEEENYDFIQLHFHWGPNDTTGSEHTLNSMQYPLEMHFVHRKRRYRSLVEALEAGQGNVLVIGVLFQVSKYANEALNPITSALKDITVAGSEVQLRPFELRRLLPEFSKYFLMYEGSLTVPPCSEGITWVIKLETATVSVEQLREFRSLLTKNNETMNGNYRPVQPLNGRSVWHIK